MSRAIHKMRGSVIPSVVFTGSDSAVNNTNTPSFANISVGEAFTGRVLIAAICYIDNDNEDDNTVWPATCTIGGVTATRRAFFEAFDTIYSFGVAIYSAVVPNGIIATVALTSTFSGTMDNWLCALFRGEDGVGAAPVDTDTGVSNFTVDTSSATFVIAASVRHDDPIGNFSGGGNIQEAVKRNIAGSRGLLVSYDNNPLGGVSDAYQVVDADGFAGAAFSV